MFEEKLKKIVDRFDFLEKEMQRNLDRKTFEEYSKEYSELKDKRDIITQFFSTKIEIGKHWIPGPQGYLSKQVVKGNRYLLIWDSLEICIAKHWMPGMQGYLSKQVFKENCYF